MMLTRLLIDGIFWTSIANYFRTICIELNITLSSSLFEIFYHKKFADYPYLLMLGHISILSLILLYLMSSKLLTYLIIGTVIGWIFVPLALGYTQLVYNLSYSNIMLLLYVYLNNYNLISTTHPHQNTL